MAVFKCKMCGGTIEFNKGDTVGICDSCGTKQVLPKVKNEVVQNIFLDANDVKVNCDLENLNKVIDVNKTSKLINKGQYYLSNRKWTKADATFSEVLKLDYSSYDAHKGKMLAQFKCNSYEEIANKHINIKKYVAFEILLSKADLDEKKIIEETIKNENTHRGKQHIKHKKIISISCKISVTVVLCACLMAFVIIPFVRYFEIKKKLSNGKVDDAVSYYKSYKFVDYNRMIKSSFEKYAENYENNKDYKNAADCYLFLQNSKKYQECMYAYGLKNLNSENYSEAANSFGKLKKYQDSKKYFYYSKGKIALSNNDVKAYDFFSKCRNFKDVEEIIQNTDWMKKLNLLQGKWKLSETLREKEPEGKYLGKGTPYSYYINKYNSVIITNSIIESEFIPDFSVKRLIENFEIINDDKFIYTDNESHEDNIITYILIRKNTMK